jgi:hypothetical protein
VNGGDRIRFEVFRRADHGKAHFLCDSHGNHVSLNELAELDACIILSRDEVDRALGEVTSKTILGYVRATLESFERINTSVAVRGMMIRIDPRQAPAA